MKNTAKKNLHYYIAFISTLLSIGLFLYLNKHHVDLKLGLNSGTSICNLSDKLNCDTAASSSYAEFFGIPMALLGAFTAGLLLVFMLLARFSLTENTERTERYTFYISSFMLIVSAAMAGVSAFLIKSACPFCIATYVLTLLTWICLLSFYRPDFSKLNADFIEAFTTEKWVPGALLSIPLLSFIVNNMTLDSYGYQQIKQMSQDSLANWQKEPLQSFNHENGLTFQSGTEEAKVVLVVFADFLCPHCRAAGPSLHNFTKSHPDIKLIFKSFPLDGTCNSALQQKGDGRRCDYAFATFCSEVIAKKGWLAHDYFFDHQDLLFASNVNNMLEGFAKDSGLDLNELKSCMNTEDVRERVRLMAKEGELAQIRGTPAVFFNGKALNGGHIPAILDSIYRAQK